ncbi:hypothetical protein LWI28_014033 [Acer negundo]|uniref:Uncharacterized protein n=1 Tax=Acer negundo TaxID=4023 RepID=A0AAD5JIW0_ACENE|nr:hypothetical protein LWI28_014033 [Acer negundo]
MHNIPPNPTPPPPSSRPLSNPTSQHPTIEVSSNNTRTLPQHEQTISKSTPSWMKALSEPPLDRNAPDLPMEDLHNDDPYYVPPILTIPSLVDKFRILLVSCRCSEVIVDLGHLTVTRKSFRTLEPTKYLDSEVHCYSPSE